MHMQIFDISRIQTPEGVFRTSGDFILEGDRVRDIRFNSLDRLGTDGWDELILSTKTNDDLAQRLIPFITAHLEVIKRTKLFY